MDEAIGLLETNSIATGIVAADAMLKAAPVRPLMSRPMCPGKYITLVSGEVSAVRTSLQAGEHSAGETVFDRALIPNIHGMVIEALADASEVERIEATGIVETFSVATLIRAADACVKTAPVLLITVRIAQGLAGKSYVILTGDMTSVTSAVEAGATVAAEEGVLFHKAVIPSPHEDLEEFLL
jgi:microcompartment protein CcmL/EutN